MVMNAEYVELNIEDIKVVDRLRDVEDDEYLKLLSENIAEIGLVEPIVVDENKVLIAGGHRLEACKRIGLKTIPSMVQKYSIENTDKQAIEISENLIRKSLNAKQIAIQYKTLADYYKSRGVDNPSKKMSEINGDTERMNNIRRKIGAFLQQKDVYNKLPDDITITTLIKLSRDVDFVEQIIKPATDPLTEQEIKDSMKSFNQTKNFYSENEETQKQKEEIIANTPVKEEPKKISNPPFPNKEEGVSNVETEEDFDLLKNEVTDYFFNITEEVTSKISSKELEVLLKDVVEKCNDYIKRC